MTIRELEEILKRENVWPHDYSLYEGDPAGAEMVYYIRGSGNSFRIFITERNKLIESKNAKSEEEACNTFLKLLIEGNPRQNERLNKYIT